MLLHICRIPYFREVVWDVDHVLYYLRFTNRGAEAGSRLSGSHISSEHGSIFADLFKACREGVPDERVHQSSLTLRSSDHFIELLYYLVTVELLVIMFWVRRSELQRHHHPVLLKKTAYFTSKLIRSSADDAVF